MATVALSAIAQASALASDGGWAGPSPASLEDEGFQQWIDDGLDEAGAIRGERHPAAEADEREASASAFEDLDPAQSRALFAGSFPLLVGLPSWDGPALPEGTEVVQYQGTSSALIAPEGSPLTAAGALESGVLPTEDDSEVGVLQSTLPLRARTEQGVLRPVDPSLESHQDHFEPTNAEVEAQVPHDLSDGIELPEADIVVTPAGANGASDAVVMGPDKLFYSGVAEDADFIATPTALGVETFLQLRSGQSPEHSSLKLELPQGAELIQSEDEAGARIEGSDGEVIATVLPPTATDADGMAVPAAMTVSGDRLELEIDHQGGDWRYPLILDPQIAYTWSGAVGQTPETTCASPAINGDSFWNWATNAPSRIGGGCVSGKGIVNLAFGGQSYYYNNNDFAQWTWTAPPHTYISSAGLQYSGFNNPNNSGACTVAGIYAPSLGGGMASWQSGDPVYCWNFSDLPNRPYGIPNTNPPHPNNSLVMQLIIPCSAYPCIRQQSMANWSQGASVVLNDDDVPQITSGTNQSSVWVDDSVSGQRQEHHYIAAATDLGLGVKHFWLQTPEGTTGYTRNCDGTMPRNPGDPVQSCISPREWSKDIGYYLPEGKSPVTVWAFDQDAKYSTPKTWTELVDRSAPVIDSIGGSLMANTGNIVSTGLYDLTVTAHDGVNATDASKRSGVEEIEVRIDGDLYGLEEQSDACDPSTQSCPSAFSPTFEIDPEQLSDGIHTLTLIATDPLGHSSSRDLAVTVRTDSEPPVLSASLSYPQGASSPSVYVSGTDGVAVGQPGAYGSGVAGVEIFVDGESISAGEFHQTCPNGGCSMPTTEFALPLGTDPATQSVIVEMSDVAGMASDSELATAPAVPFDYFGYNLGNLPDSANNPQVLRRAVAGGADTVRINVNWCDVEHIRNTWDWSKVHADLDQVWSLNPVNGAPKVRVIAELIGTPPWARADNAKTVQNASAADFNGCGPELNGLVRPEPGVDPRSVTASTFVPAADRWDEFAVFVRKFLQEFGPSASQRYGVSAIELWNEPNFANFWGDFRSAPPFGSAETVYWKGADPDALGAMLSETEAELGSVGLRNEVEVLAPGMSPANIKLSEDAGDVEARMFDEATGAGRYLVDGLSLHFYKNSVGNVSRAVQKVVAYGDEMMAIRSSFSQLAGVKPWLTEVGFPSRNYNVLTGKSDKDLPGIVSPARQRAKFRRLFNRLATRDRFGEARSFVVHTLYDCSSNGAQTGCFTLDQSLPGSEGIDERGGFGLWGFPQDAQPRPIFCDLREWSGTTVAAIAGITPDPC